MERFKATIDNKNLMEDAFTHDVFQGFFMAPDHMTWMRRHMIGHEKVKDENGDAVGDAYVDVKWTYGGNSVDIQVIATPDTDDYAYLRDLVFDHYEKVFKEWQCEDNRDLVVETKRVLDILTVSFYFDVES